MGSFSHGLPEAQTSLNRSMDGLDAVLVIRVQFATLVRERAKTDAKLYDRDGRALYGPEDNAPPFPMRSILTRSATDRSANASPIR